MWSRTDLGGGARWLRRNIELSSLLFLVLSVLAIWAFAELADEVLEGETTSLDQSLLLLMREADDTATPLGPPWVQEMGRDLTAMGGVVILSLVTFGVAGFFLLRREIGATLYLMAAVGGGMLISHYAKAFFDRPRPDLVPHGSFVHTASFPSGHSMMAAVVYLTLGALVARTLRQRRLKIYVLAIAIFVSLLVGVSRVYLGVHWPTDVLAGWLAGAGWAALCLFGSRLLVKRMEAEPDAPEPPSRIRPTSE